MFLNSIRWRLQLWLAFLLVAVLTGFGATVYQFYRLTQLNQFDEELKTRVGLLSSSLRSGPGGPSSRREPPDRRGPGPGFGERGSQPPPEE